MTGTNTGKRFIGRKQETDRLTQLMCENGQRTALVYGRRRVGKSALIRYALKKSKIPGIYYECKQTSEQDNTDSLAVLIAEHFRIPQPAFRKIEDALSYLFQKAEEKALVVMLDEYSHLRDVVSGMDSILQSLLDKFERRGNLKLVLCGSYVDTMKKLLLKDNPLYGRIEMSIDLQPMDYLDSSRFYSSFSEEDKVRLYSVFGGIPYYNRLIDATVSVRENIIRLLSAPGARLENEVTMNLQSEIGKINNANEVFMALAKGFSRFGDILSQSHVSSSPALADVLDRLIRMGVVEKEAPINDADNKRKTGYYICDNLSLFFFRYIFSNASQRQVMEADAFYDRFIKADFEENYVPKRFESVCRQYLIRKNRAGEIKEPFFLIGKYYYDLPAEHKNGEFDVVTQDEKGFIFYEAKFRAKPLSKEMVYREIAQVEASGLQSYRYGFFSRSAFPKLNDEKIISIGLKQMYRYGKKA